MINEEFYTLDQKLSDLRLRIGITTSGLVAAQDDMDFAGEILEKSIRAIDLKIAANDHLLGIVTELRAEVARLKEKIAATPEKQP